MSENPTNSKEQLRIGINSFFGDGVPQDSEKGVYWITKAAEQDERDAQCFLGVIFFQGNGVLEDIEKAVYWFAKAWTLPQ